MSTEREGGWPVGRCRSPRCRAEVIWATSERSGRPIPVDTTPGSSGNLALVLVGDRIIARIVPPDRREQQAGEDLYSAHFVTCPAAKQLRRTRRV